jgi:RND family efflux transporter MFP subunit
MSASQHPISLIKNSFPMRNLIFIIGTSVVFAACGSKADTNNTRLSNPPIPVRIAEINSDTNRTQIIATGLLSTEEEARLSFKIGGVIDKIFIKEGQFVKKGQLLATLKATEIEAQVSQVELAAEKARRDYLRASNLYKDSVATLEQVQNAKTGVDLAQKNLQQVAFNQHYSKIYAVSDGFIVKQILHEGELANPGSQVLFMSAISATSRWILKIGVADKEWAVIEKGNKALVAIDAFPDKKFKSVVSRKALSADPVSGSFEVEVAVDFEGEQPAIGMFGKAYISPANKSVGFSIPYEALLEANGKTGYVFVTNDQKTVKRLPVTIGSIDDQQVYVSSGLQGYRYVVISGSPYLDDNSIISIN